MRELEREDRVARLQRGHVDGHVRLRARVRLDVRVLGAEELLRAVDRELLDLVDDLAAAVVAPARVALGVLVRRHRADRLEHRRPGEVLGGDQLDLAPLPLELAAEQLGDLRVDLGEPGGAELLRRSPARRPSPWMVLAAHLPAVAASARSSASAAGTAPSRRTRGSVAGEVEHGGRRARELAAVERRPQRRRGSPPARPRAAAGRARRGGSRSWRRPRRTCSSTSAPGPVSSGTRTPIRSGVEPVSQR